MSLHLSPVMHIIFCAMSFPQHYIESISCSGHLGSSFTGISFPWVCFLPFLLPRSACVLSRSVASDSLQCYGLSPTRVLCPWDSPGKNTGLVCHVHLQRIFPIQGLNSKSPKSLHCSQILCYWHHLGSLSLSDFAENLVLPFIIFSINIRKK